jgi:hypothetical protein
MVLTNRISSTAIHAIRRGCASSNNITTPYRAMNISATSSPWSSYDMAPLDPIIGLSESYQADTFPQKVNVGVGAYRTDLGKPYVLPCVQKAEQRLLDAQLDMEYSGIVSSVFFLFLSMFFLSHFVSITNICKKK